MDSHGLRKHDVERRSSYSGQKFEGYNTLKFDGCNSRRSPRWQSEFDPQFGVESCTSQEAKSPSRQPRDGKPFETNGAGPQEPDMYGSRALGNLSHRGLGSCNSQGMDTPIRLPYQQWDNDYGSPGSEWPSPKMSPREESPPRIEDTTIGKGFSAFLKRGVAEAKPKEQLERAEMVPSKDGGFITTIQRGFEGIFGHLASSKEEVLKKRGPMPAPEYEAVPGDDIDQRVEYYARQLPYHLGTCLQIFRVERGQYEIGSDQVRLMWQSRVNPPNTQNPNGQIIKEVFVFIGSDNVDQGNPRHDWKDLPSEPLPYYLRHSANVAYDLQCGSAMSKIPESNRLSFAEEQGTLLVNSDADAKYAAMNVATEQAKLREQAALEWKKQKSNDAVGPRVTRDRSNEMVENLDTEKILPKPPPPAPIHKQDAENYPPPDPTQFKRENYPPPDPTHFKRESPRLDGPERLAEESQPRTVQPLPLPEPPPLVVPPPGNPLGIAPPQLKVPPLSFKPPTWNLPEVSVMQPPNMFMNNMQGFQPHTTVPFVR